MNELSFTSWNINGIRAIYKKEGFMEWFNTVDSDVISFQETKAQIDQIPKYFLENDKYFSYFNFPLNKGVSGVACFSKIEPNEVITDIDEEKFDKDGRFLRLDFDDFILVNVYCPSALGGKRLDYKLDFYNELFEYLNKLKNKGNNLIICGDFNVAHNEVDLANPDLGKKSPGFLPIEREKIDKFLDNGFIDTFRMFNKNSENYTWISYPARSQNRHSGLRLDYFFVSESLKDNLQNSSILSDIQGSDHYPINLKINI